MASDENYDIPESGAVFTFGKSGFADNQQSHFFIRNDPVVEISCGDEHTAIVCQNGRVFLFGHNDYGQLGLGHTRSITKPSCLKYLKPFHSTHVACGKGHTVVGTQCGRLFSFGSNSDGQLGLGDLNDKIIPQLISTKRFNEEGIKAVSAGCFHSACLTGNGELYVWGSNTDGQCGTDIDTNLLIPTKVEFDGPIDYVSCGYYHTAFLSEGFVYTFGEEENGKLGYKKKDSNLPHKLEIDFKSVQVKCGGNHTLILSDNGKPYGCGSNFSGQLGGGHNSKELSTPVPVNFPTDVKIIFMSAGESHSAFITENGELYTCGDGRYGKTCLEDESVISMSPTLISLFSCFHCAFVSCGGCQTMVLARARTDVNDSGYSKRKILNLPPLKTTKTFLENENIIRDALQGVEQEDEIEKTQEESSRTAEDVDDREENQPQQNENNINDAHVDDIYLDIREEQDHVEHIAENIVEKDVQKHVEPDVVVGVEGRIKKFFNAFRKKKPESATAVVVKQDSTAIDSVDEGKPTPGRLPNQHKSRTCTIL